MVNKKGNTTRSKASMIQTQSAGLKESKPNVSTQRPSLREVANGWKSFRPEVPFSVVVADRRAVKTKNA